MSSVHMVGMNSIYGHEEADVSIICHLRAAIKGGKKELQVIYSYSCYIIAGNGS